MLLLQRILHFYFAILSVIFGMVPAKDIWSAAAGLLTASSVNYEIVRDAELIVLAGIFGIASWAARSEKKAAAQMRPIWTIGASCLALIIMIGIPLAHYVVQGWGALLQLETAFALPQVIAAAAAVISILIYRRSANKGIYSRNAVRDL